MKIKFLILLMCLNSVVLIAQEKKWVVKGRFLHPAMGKAYNSESECRAAIPYRSAEDLSDDMLRTCYAYFDKYYGWNILTSNNSLCYQYPRDCLSPGLSSNVSSLWNSCSCVEVDASEAESSPTSERKPLDEPLLQLPVAAARGLVEAFSTTYDDNTEKYSEEKKAERAATSNAAIRSGGNTQVPTIPQYAEKTKQNRKELTWIDVAEKLKGKKFKPNEWTIKGIREYRKTIDDILKKWGGDKAAIEESKKMYEEMQFHTLYYNQLANKFKNGRFGENSCNVTTLSMCLSTLGIDVSPDNLMKKISPKGKEIKDEEFIKQLTNTSTRDVLAKELGVALIRNSNRADSENDIKERGKEIEKELLKGHSVAISVGTSTGGHIVQVVGIEKDNKGNPIGFIVNDPYGRLNFEKRKKWEESTSEEKKNLTDNGYGIRPNKSEFDSPKTPNEKKQYKNDYKKEDDRKGQHNVWSFKDISTIGLKYSETYSIKK